MLEGELSHFMCKESENEKNKKVNVFVSRSTYVMFYFSFSAINSTGST